MLGAVYGDIIGSCYEVRCTKDYRFPLLPDSRFTDDTVMTAAVFDAILYNDRQISAFSLKRRAMEYAVRYRQYYSRYPDAGFGEMFAAWASRDMIAVQKSYGNGAAMRAVPIGYAYQTLEQTLLQTKASCMYTHRHQEAIRGAMAVSGAVWLARHKKTKQEIREWMERRFSYKLDAELDGIRSGYRFDPRTSYSVPPAIMAFLQSTDYEDAVRKAVSLGGDADTMACIAGGIAEAYYGEIPCHIRRFCDARLDSNLREIFCSFYARYCLN